MVEHSTIYALPPSWFVYKQPKPLKEDIVRFTPYPESDDNIRGTTVLPYLEAFYQYGTNEDRGFTTIKAGLEPSPQHVIQEGNWVSEDDMFDSNASMHSSEKSVENIALRKSRVSSQENGEGRESLGMRLGPLCDIVVSMLAKGGLF